MAAPLTQDYDANVEFSFVTIPASPPLANRLARVRRAFTVAFAQGWLACLLYRIKRRLRDAGIPVLPVALDLLNRALFRVSIGDAVDVGPGLMLPHGNVVVDGRVRIGRGCQINPWVTIGLSNSRKLGFSVDGPTIGDHVHIGTGAKLLGPITVGDYARIGANAVVVHDVPANTTVIGAPARPVNAASAPARDDGPPSTKAAESENLDDRLVAHMRQSIVDYRLQRQSLRSLVDALFGSFEIASPALQPLHDQLREDLVFLDAVADAGDTRSPQVDAAITAIDAALVSHTSA